MPEPVFPASASTLLNRFNLGRPGAGKHGGYIVKRHVRDKWDMFMSKCVGQYTLGKYEIRTAGGTKITAAVADINRSARRMAQRIGTGAFAMRRI